MKYKLFLDDIRNVPMVFPNLTNTDIIIVRSYVDFVSYINENGLPSFISFDNDLGEDENHLVLPDGHDCAKWLVYESGLNIKDLTFNVHSANPVAKKQIEGLLTNYIHHCKEEYQNKALKTQYKIVKAAIKLKHPKATEQEQVILFNEWLSKNQ